MRHGIGQIHPMTLHAIRYYALLRGWAFHPKRRSQAASRNSWRGRGVTGLAGRGLTVIVHPGCPEGLGTREMSVQEMEEMMVSPLRIMLMPGLCIGLVACSQPMAPPMAQSTAAAPSTQTAMTPVAGDQSSTTRKARVCTTRGNPATAGVSNPWSITVSNEGLPCPHNRELGNNNEVYQIMKPPQHGQISQQSKGNRTTISYTPAPGYTGTDSFSMRYLGRNMEMPYMVNVIP